MLRGGEKQSLVEHVVCCLCRCSSMASVSEDGQSSSSSSVASGGGGRGKGGVAVSDNFIRLNMKVKKFSRRPGRSLTGSAYKRHVWKKRQNQQSSGTGGTAGGGGAGTGVKKGGRNVCFKCGKPGHWAKNCTDNGGSKNLGKFAGEAVKFNDDIVLGREDDIDLAVLEELARNSPFPTVHEAAMMARGIKVIPKTATLTSELENSSENTCSSAGSTDSYVAPPPCHTRSTPPPPSVDPLYPLTDDGHIITSRLTYT